MQNVNDTIYFDKDASLDVIQSKKVAIIGYGNQGRAQALNLKDSGVDVKIGLRAGSSSINAAKREGFDYDTISSAVQWGDIIGCLIPDQYMADVYKNDIEQHLTRHKTLLFSHGYNIHYKLIKPKDDCNVIMVAPSGPGYAVRKRY